MIAWLFPGQGSTRMPIIAVTGTNGKTTTCRMISFILQHSGRTPGLVCSDGIFLNGVQVSDSDACSFLGHARVLTSKLVDTAVLEAHHRGIAVRGFAFDTCNVAVCLNVTEEHLIEGEIESLEEMAQIKRALPERASDAAVLFADDQHCISMRDFLSAKKICLVSLCSSARQLRAQFEDKAAYMCVLETIEGADWLTIHDRQKRLPVIPVNQVPATFDGAARFNVSNAMHAAAASYLAGTEIESIRSALSKFKAGTELTPGRMNVFDDLPFKIIIDYAHSPDSVKKVCEFVDKQDVSGRKLIAFSGSTERVDLQNRHVASEIAGHFDFYFCKDYQGPDQVERGFIAPFMQQVLIEEGVPEANTTVLTYGKEVIFNILDACEPGDLLVMLLGTFEKVSAPAYIREFADR
jgi:cyanophycin synthetase